MNSSVKNVIDKLFDLCDSIESTINSSTINNRGYREILKKECIDFLSYLSASDGTISDFEAEFISEYFGNKMSAEELKVYIENHNTYTTQFEQTIPETLKRLIKQDNEKYVANKELSLSASEAYIVVFESMGKEFLVCDGESDEQEVADFTTYISNLRTYKNEHILFSHKVNSAISAIDINENQVISQDNEKNTLESLLEELDNLVGLQVVKNDVNSLVHLQEIKRLRKARGLKEIPVSNHLVFYGNPGTGKTTVARLLARIYHAMGILSKGQFVEVDRSGLVAGYVGQTALKVQEVVEKSLGGVLFVDEAYALSYSTNGNDYGQEAIDTLLKAMEDHRDDFIVIVAGYPELMSKFIDSNPGLRSRFNKYINFEDYTVKELGQIFSLMCENAGYTASSDVTEYVMTVFENKFKNRGKNFANAREVRNFFEKAMVNQADRLFSINNPTNEQLCELTIFDVEGLG